MMGVYLNIRGNINTIQNDFTHIHKFLHIPKFISFYTYVAYEKDVSSWLAYWKKVKHRLL